MREDRAHAPPRLWFPRADVDETSVIEADETGTGEWDGHICFDDDVVVELHDPTGSGDGDVPTIAFPNWGDAADLVAVLDVRRAHDGSWTGRSVEQSDRPVVEGSQLLAQSMVAGSRHAPGRRVVQATMIFNRAVSTEEPYAIHIDEVTNGRSLTALRTAVTQGDRTGAFGTLLLDAGTPDLIRHGVDAPPVGRPADAVPYDMGVTGRALRVVDAAYTGDPGAPIGPPRLHAWVRFAAVPTDQAIHAALLAQFAGHMSIAAALRPHAAIGQDQAHRTISTAINAISLSIHADVRADRWMHYDHHATFAGDGMTHSDCRVHDESGHLLASFSVEAMVRGFAQPDMEADPRTSL